MFLITLYLGCFGVHKFIRGEKELGKIYLCTFGLLGFGWLYDVFVAGYDIYLFYFNKEKYKEKYRDKFIDEEKKQLGWTKIANKVYIYERSKKIEINERLFDFSDILSSEFFENNEVVSVINRTESIKGESQTQKHVAPFKAMFGAAVGGAIAGKLGSATGAIIGGTAGKDNTKYNESLNSSEMANSYGVCNSLFIKVSVKSLTNPCEFIRFIEKPISKKETLYLDCWEAANKCQAVLEKVIELSNFGD